jgi:ribosome-binding factor A
MPSKSRRPQSAKGPSQRQLRVGETLRHALSEILMREDFFDPDLANVSITISEISVSPDLANARVYTMPLGGVNIEVVLPALNRLAPLIPVVCCLKKCICGVPRACGFCLTKALKTPRG